MMPMNTDPELPKAYQEEAEKVGYTGGFVMVPNGPTFVHVTDDPERTWAQIGDYLLYETQDLRVVPDAGPALDADGRRRRPRRACKASPQIVVGTPDEIVARLADDPADAARSPSTRSPAACRPTSRGRASSCSPPRCTRGSRPPADVARRVENTFYCRNRHTSEEAR